jgi:hypothetical protein
VSIWRGFSSSEIMSIKEVNLKHQPSTLAKDIRNR